MAKTTELSEYVRCARIRFECDFRAVVHKTENFTHSVFGALGEISREEAIDAIKTLFCEEMDKIK